MQQEHRSEALTRQAQKIHFLTARRPSRVFTGGISFVAKLAADCNPPLAESLKRPGHQALRQRHSNPNRELPCSQ
jgi:hypothetical protein